MNSSRVIGIALVVALVLGMSALSFAAGPAQTDQPASTGKTGKFSMLSPEKQEIAKKLHGEFRQSTAKARESLGAKNRELRDLMSAPSLDEGKIQTVAKEIADLRATVYLARISMQTKLAKEGITFGHGSNAGKGDGHSKRMKRKEKAAGKPNGFH